MRPLHTTLLTGPYDWDAAILPRAEFEARLGNVRATLAASGADALLVFGNAGDYGALNYLTGFVPKLDSALALVPMTGGIRLIVAGTSLMLPAAKLLTWVEDVRPFANVPKLVAEWLGSRETTLATWGAGAMAHGLSRGIAGALGPKITITAQDAALDPIRRKKSSRELDLMRRAGKILGRAAAAFVASSGKGARTAAHEAERAAIAEGAQDARMLASARPGGPPLPFDGAADNVLDPLIAAIMVRHAGYWAEGVITVTTAPGPALAHARDALAAVLRLARPGVSGTVLEALAREHRLPLAAYPTLADGIGIPIGLSLEEGPAVGASTLEAGATYIFRIGAQGLGTDVAIVSAMAAIGESGAEVLWSEQGVAEGM